MPDVSSDSHYIHGTEPEEQRRLKLMNELLNRHCVDALGPVDGARLLDLGSGLGHLAASYAQRVGPSGRVVGIERSAEQLDQARRLSGSNFEFRLGAGEDPPLEEDEWGSFDLVHTRFLLEHVRDPLAIVRSMVRAARPGGRIILADDDHDVLRLYPEPEGFADLWSAYMRAYTVHGNDPHVGRKLVSLLYQAGAQPRRAAWLPFGSCAGEALFPAYAQNMAGVIETARTAMIANGLIREESYVRAMAAIRDWAARPDAALWYALCWAEGERSR